MRATAAPRISILLPAFDAEQTLPAALRSIERQTETRWECVVVDDGSRDSTAACARGFAARDGRFVVVSTPHRGVVEALNTGLDDCRGEVVARMDADDLMHRLRLARQTAVLEETGAAAAGCHVRLFPRAALGDGNRAYERWLNAIDSPERIRREAFVECPVAHPALMIRRSVLAALRYRDCGWPEDYDLVLRLLESGGEIAVACERLLGWRHRSHRLSRTDPRYAIARFTACKATFLASSFLARGDTYILCGYGGTGKALRAALLQHGKRPAYIVDLHPGRVGKTIHGAPVVRPRELVQIPPLPIVASVAGEESREQIRRALTSMGLRELEDFVCAA